VTNRVGVLVAAELGEEEETTANEIVSNCGFCGKAFSIGQRASVLA